MSKHRENKLLKAYGFETAKPGDGVGVECCDCDKPCAGRRGYWLRTSIEYDEWDVRCRPCALAHVALYEDFDADAYVAVAN